LLLLCSFFCFVNQDWKGKNKTNQQTTKTNEKRHRLFIPFRSSQGGLGTKVQAQAKIYTHSNVSRYKYV